MTRPPLVLASGSPRRRELLEMLGLALVVDPADVDETPHADEDPVTYVARVAADKAAVVAARQVGALVLAADTTVTLAGEILGKPADAADAARMLARLAGREHAVHTAVAVAVGERVELAVETTSVRFVALTDAEIDWYVATGEPLDKAGAYAIQGAGGLFVERIDGSASNVVGLPLHVVERLVERVGLSLLDYALPGR
jgi:septum formation protein